MRGKIKPSPLLFELFEIFGKLSYKKLSYYDLVIFSGVRQHVVETLEKGCKSKLVVKSGTNTSSLYRLSAPALDALLREHYSELAHVHKKAEHLYALMISHIGRIDTGLLKH